MKRTHLIAALVGIVAAGIFAADASAMYHPGMGVFMSRDPGAGRAMRIGAGGPATGGGFIPRDPAGRNQYADGMSLYQYIGSTPVGSLDPTGLWKIKRTNESLALAFAEKNDTIKGLADEIGLDFVDWNKWVTTVPSTRTWRYMRGPEYCEGNGTGPIKDPNRAMAGCEVVRIPNMVIAYWGGELGGVGKGIVGWGRERKVLEERGFLVQEDQGWTGSQLEGYIRHAQSDKVLHGIFIWAHGNALGVGTDVTKRRDDSYVSYYMNWRPHYRMALGILFACETRSARPYFAGQGRFWGKSGDLVPLTQPRVSTIIPPGAQGSDK